MKEKFCVILLILIFSSFLGCTSDENINLHRETIIQPRFLEQDLQWGNLFAKTITNAVYQLEAKKTTNSNDVFNSIAKDINNFYKIPSRKDLKLTNKKNSEYTNEIITAILVNNARSLTSAQKKILIRIDNAKKKSESFSEFVKKLTQINEDIYINIPKKEQKKLFFVTSTLFFGFKAINDYHFKKVSISSIISKTYSPLFSVFGINTAYAQEDNNDDDDDWWGECDGQLLSVWTIALAEPTPIGEVVATLATIYIGGVLVAELITECFQSDEISTPLIDINTCIDAYVTCTEVTPYDDCSTCLSFCGTQGYWPSDICPLRYVPAPE
ncbi:hypothetical protein [Aestuariivivens insulae]|uniref:hypothetical protein n=1 Tax=Aestuariivivens insulae TaxID=1621988 RepID=UPI001F569F70|nr:hypothetical protein [Aestuariivivens insulae]